MKYSVISIPYFDKEFKKLAKKYPSLLDDILVLSESLKANPLQGRSLGNSFYKVRMTIVSKGQGKSGGARVITYIKVLGTTVYLASIYDKSEKSTITPKELKEILNLIP